MYLFQNVSELSNIYNIPIKRLEKIFAEHGILIVNVGRSPDNKMVKQPEANRAILEHIALILGPTHYLENKPLHELVDLSEYETAVKMLSRIPHVALKHPLVATIAKRLGYSGELWLMADAWLFIFKKDDKVFVVNDLFEFIEKLPRDIKRPY
ncbi:hypothetical protein [Pseudothermotoga sp.]|uniref:hypothetical protein n=1 Tax=Pseudothermotoga sp. TaxID=2033661 RepID=UPI000E88B6A3|nr:hypothetical protein [Pseudothermotoga sp.]HBJ81583.1 hypothetical protein [Pseudothermotoga sp.]